MKSKTLIAKVVSVKGLKGELKLKVFSSNPLVIKNYALTFDDGKAIKIVSCYLQSNVLIAKFDGVDTREQAEKLVSKDIYTNAELWDKPTKDEFYHIDLIDIKVVSKEKKLLGKVVAVHNFGAGDILEIQFINNDITEMLRFIETFFPEVNLKEGYIVFDEPIYM